ncbi:metalloprotease, partial [Candidatus Woesearchaeota archaeon]|nr:metalloprotease [Candidatus Woesearchaeota archaeon]
MNSPISTSKAELVDLLKAWVAISTAFAIVLTGLRLSAEFFIGIAVAAITVGIGFLLHELAHKVIAQHYGCFAEFRSFDTMLLLAVVLSFFGFIFAAPGAVMISGQVTRRENGLISVVGPWTNLVLALAFLGLNISVPALSLVWAYGFQINTWLALFNMIPFWLLDGRKVWMWNKAVWGATVAAALG